MRFNLFLKAGLKRWSFTMLIAGVATFSGARAAETFTSVANEFQKIQRMPAGMVYVEAGRDGQKAFGISRHEITNEDYLFFLEATGFDRLPATWTERRVPSGMANHPVVGVSYADAMAYADWASIEIGGELSLPTETQINRASLGARVGKVRRALGKLTRPVESDPMDRSVYGVYDLAGSVDEWTSSARSMSGGAGQVGFRLAWLPDGEREAEIFSVVAEEPGPVPVSPSDYPRITLQPVSQSAPRGSNVSLAVGATGTSALSYQWYVNGVAIAGATSSTLQLTNLRSTDAGAYSAIVTNTITAVGDTASDIRKYTYSTTSETAQLAVVEGAAPVITQQPASQTVAAGPPASFHVTVAGGAPFVFKWSISISSDGRLGSPSVNAVTITETADSSTLNISTTEYSAADISVTVTNAFGTTTSAVVKLVAITGGKSPSITAQPVSVTINTGGNAVFRVEASGSPQPSYQWNLNGTPVAGATSASLSVANAQAANAGNYTVVVSNALGSVTSGVAALTVNAATPAPTTGGGGTSGGGGGGAPSNWFLGTLLLLVAARVGHRVAGKAPGERS
jgi:hypothetical protein